MHNWILWIVWQLLVGGLALAPGVNSVYFPVDTLYEKWHCSNWKAIFLFLVTQQGLQGICREAVIGNDRIIKGFFYFSLIIFLLFFRVLESSGSRSGANIFNIRLILGILFLNCIPFLHFTFKHGFLFFFFFFLLFLTLHGLDILQAGGTCKLSVQVICQLSKKIKNIQIFLHFFNLFFMFLVLV